MVATVPAAVFSRCRLVNRSHVQVRQDSLVRCGGISRGCGCLGLRRHHSATRSWCRKVHAWHDRMCRLSGCTRSGDGRHREQHPRARRGLAAPHCDSSVQPVNLPHEEPTADARRPDHCLAGSAVSHTRRPGPSGKYGAFRTWAAVRLDSGTARIKTKEAK